MAQFYTLEEAARVLGLSPEELKSKAQAREVRAFLDSGSWRFRVVDVDELARRRGLGSDAELRLSDLEGPTTGSGSSEIQDLDMSEFHLGVSKPDLADHTSHLASVAEMGGGKSTDDSGSDHEVLLDDLSLPPDQMTGSSSVIIGSPTTGKRPSDSDIRLVPDNVKSSSDSDVQLASPSHKHPSDSDVTLIKDDTLDHGLMAGSKSDDNTSVRKSPLLGSSAEVPAADSGSNFELNPSSELIDALQPDSGSDFELSALDASDEFEATPLTKPSDSDVTASDPKLSGINLSRPSDSGINLQGGLGLGQADSIELAPLSDDDLPSTGPKKPASKKTPASTAKPSKPKASLAATPPPSVQKGEKDIFDDTDFEVDIPSVDADSDDKTVQLEAASDFDLDDSDSGSEVFAIDEEDVDQNASTAMAPAAIAEDDDDDDDGFDSAVSSEMTSAWSSSDQTVTSAERAGPAMVMSRDAEQEWSGLWVGLLGVTSVFLLFSSFVALDLVRNLYDFHEGGTFGSGFVRALAGLFGG
jgi:hypothetical protein